MQLSGRVLDTLFNPVPGALVDIWHADRMGRYDDDGFRFRGRLRTDAEGRFSLRTIKPLHYCAFGEKRPAHLHVKIIIAAREVLTTQLFFEGDPWNREDPFFRPALVMSTSPKGDGLDCWFEFIIDPLGTDATS
jgi:protocatechuate 3,4-dioxygenase beta subunit